MQEFWIVVRTKDPERVHFPAETTGWIRIQKNEQPPPHPERFAEHAQEHLAVAEAERLARENPRCEFTVFKAISRSRRTDVETVRFTDMPF